MGRLGGKIAVITGANSSIGLASAKRFDHYCSEQLISGFETGAVFRAVRTSRQTKPRPSRGRKL
jgi:NADP-dependent 3-hydroxy acid dehydrogenase YdfG